MTEPDVRGDGGGVGGQLSGHARVLQSLLVHPAWLIALGAVAAVVAFQFWIDPANPPGFIRDEASFSFNAYAISQDLHDQSGALLPLYLPSFGDYKSTPFVYLLAAVFRVTGPHAEVARGLAAFCVLAAVLLVGLLALRRTRSIAVAASVVVLGGLTPWLFELGRVAYDTALLSFFIALLLVSVEWALRSPRGALLRALPVAFALAGIAYGYAAGRLLAPLFAAALVVFARRGRWRWLFAVWALFGIGLVRLGVYWSMHPGALTARFDQTKFIQKGQGSWSILGQTIENYFHDLNLWHWSVSGDPKPYIHTWGAAQLYGSAVALAVIGAIVVVRRRPADRFGLYVIALLLLAPIPSALSEDRFNALRLVAVPLLIVAVAIPGLELICQTVRVSWLARAVAVAMIAAIGYQFADFLHWYTYRGPARTQVFEAGVQPMLARAFAHGRTVYIDYDDHYAQTHALWYAVSHGMSRSRVSILPDGGIAPVGSILFYRFQTCDFACTEIGRWNEYWLARSKGPKAS